MERWRKVVMKNWRKECVMQSKTETKDVEVRREREREYQKRFSEILSSVIMMKKRRKNLQFIVVYSRTGPLH